MSGETVTLTREMLLGAVRGPLYAPALAAGLPAAIAAAAAGRFDALFGLSAMLASRPEARLAMGMHFSVVCAEDLPRLAASRDVPGADFGRDFARLYRQACAVWPRGAVPAGFYRVPSQYFAGAAAERRARPGDAAAPRRRVARELGPLAQHVVVPNAGHGVMAIGCTADVIFRFIDAADDRDAAAVDAGCVKGIPRPPAFRPVEAAGEPG